MGEGVETAVWDLKRRLSKQEFHLAKDVAAFANHLGGTLLVGAEEDGSGRIAQYDPMSASEAAAAENDLANAVRNRCRPLPLVDYTRVSHSSGFVLAVNVWPSVTTLIGVSVAAAKSDGFGGIAYTFPVRLTNHTTWLASDNIAMHLIPELRRKLILLESIPAGEHVLLCPFDGHNRPVVLEQIDEATNTLRIRAVKEGGTVFVPLDDVQAVFRAGTDAPPHWRIRTKR